MSDYRSAARAAVLAGTLASTPLPNTIVQKHLSVPAIRVVTPDQRPTLNLDAVIFRYRVALDGRVKVVDDPAGARRCTAAHRRR